MTPQAVAKRPNVDFLDYADTGEAALVDAGGFWPRFSQPMRKGGYLYDLYFKIG